MVDRIRAFLRVAFPGQSFVVRQGKDDVLIFGYEGVDWEVVHSALLAAGLVLKSFDQSMVKE